MILLLGASSYIGQAFAREMRARGECFIPLSLRTLDYTRFELLFDYVRSIRPSFLINAGGEGGETEGDALESSSGEVFQVNTLLPQVIGRACLLTNTPWGHVSSASIYRGAKVYQGGELKIETDLDTARVRRLFAAHPESFVGFSETDDPNFCFRSPPCTYEAGTKALAEEWLRGRDGTFIWRLGALFDDCDDPCNVLSRLQASPRILDHFLSVSHLSEFVRCCLELRSRHAQFGIYNIVNPGTLTTRDIAQMIEKSLKPARPFKFWKNQTEFLLNSSCVPSSSCIVDASKVMRTGLKLRPARVAIESALKRWQPRYPPSEPDSMGRSDSDSASVLRLVRPS